MNNEWFKKSKRDQKIIQIFGTNASVNKVNKEMLKKLDSPLLTSEAIHIPSRTNIKIKPSGTIEDTALLQTLQLIHGV